MKLLTRTSIYYLLFALPVFALCSFLLYHHVSSQIMDNLDESLWKEKVKAEQLIRSGKSVPQDEHLVLMPAPMGTPDTMTFSDLLLYDSIEGEVLPYRELSVFFTVDNIGHHLVVRKSAMESDDLIEGIMYPVIILFVLLLAGFLLINVMIARRMWRPFYSSLEKLNHFSISAGPVEFDTSSVKEFSELNKALGRMTEKIRMDYAGQKKFVENASHEIQTPLAVIRGKIEWLIQSTSLTEKDMETIQAVYTAAGRLSSLNKALLLLSKIENDHFPDVEKVELGPLLEKVLQHYSDMAELKDIRVSKSGTSAPVWKMNPALADILLSNLVQNAIRHNVKGGTIDLHLSDRLIRISNSSEYHVDDTAPLFERFRKNELSAESIGLGLSIVKEICDKYGIRVEYSCSDKTHLISLEFIGVQN